MEQRKVTEGSALIYNPRATSGVIINELDPELWNRFLEAYRRLVPLKADYRDNDE